MAMLLSEKQITQLKRRVRETPHPREMVLDVLHAIQDANGWVSDEGIELAAIILGLSPLQVEEVATFYDKIYRRPVGRKVIHICDSICCWSRGSETLMLRLQQLLGIVAGETTADGMFTLLPTCCLGPVPKRRHCVSAKLCTARWHPSNSKRYWTASGRR